MFDRDLRYVVCSNEWLRQYDLRRAEIIGRSHYEVFPDIPERWKKIHAECLDGATRRSDLDVFERANGRKQYLRWVVEPWYQADGVVGGILMLTEDLTSTVETRARLEQSSRLSALGEMAGGIAHEINNPLAIITGFCERIRLNLSRGQTTSEEMLRDINKIQAGAERISRVVVSMQALASERSFAVLSVSLRDVIEDVLELSLENFKFRGIDLKIVYAESESRLPVGRGLFAPEGQSIAGDEVREITREIPPELKIMGERTGVSQILINLLNNSMYAVRLQERKAVQLTVVSQKDAGLSPWIEIRISDSGQGVSDTVRNSIFAPFFTTKAPGEGTGLGLSLSRSLAVRFGGSLELAEGRSALGGAAFLLRLRRSGFN